MGQNRLGSAYPRLANLFDDASDECRARAVTALCEIGVRENGCTDDDVDAAMDLVRGGASDEALSLRLIATAATFDSQYFDLSDDEDVITPEALAAFQRARLVAALACAVSADRSQFDEALYEALHALSDDARVIQIAEAALAR